MKKFENIENLSEEVEIDFNFEDELGKIPSLSVRRSPEMTYYGLEIIKVSTKTFNVKISRAALPLMYAP